LGRVIVLNETGLRRILKSYFDYYENSRTHLSLNKDAPAGRAIEPPGIGRVMEIPQVGGLHHLYTGKLLERRRYSKRIPEGMSQ